MLKALGILALALSLEVGFLASIVVPPQPAQVEVASAGAAAPSPRG